ncbi:DUF1481 domain-containing protein [Vibrio sp. WXL103]|uniref:DUF1481 domain-containing protein n=1 Tax=unclassified Vibrio TaxID=2614977 RepID=UPI003EC7A7B1
MKRNHLFTSLAILTLAGCASSGPNPAIEQIRDLTGGQIVGDATSLYWSSDRLGEAVSASDHVMMGDYGYYQTEYRWEDGVVRELVRQGTQLNDNELVPFRLHVRFNKDGNAIYQRYRIDGNVRPVSSQLLANLKSDAAGVVAVTRDQDQRGFDLFQGYWDGQEFNSCSGSSFPEVKFNYPMPKVLMNRLASVDSYVALVGRARSTRIEVEQLLLLDDDGRDCIERPELIED